MLHILNKIRRRPGLYIAVHSPTHLDSFLSGFYLATNSTGNDCDLFNFIRFSDWVAKKFNYFESTSGWAHMIEDQCDDKEESLWLFFELLDEFMGIVHKTIHSIEYSPISAPHLSAFYMQSL